MDTTIFHKTYEQAAKNTLNKIGRNITMAVPLGVCKPVGLINALYRLALKDSSIQLTIITGLTLARPTIHNELEKRFIEPILNRILTNFEDPLYEYAREKQQLPANICIIEFFLSPGKYLHNNNVQQNYINSNYTTVVRDTERFKVNVIAQQVAHSTSDINQYSLSCNSDLFIQAADSLKSKTEPFMIIGEVNKNLPFMQGDAIIQKDCFTDIIDTGHYPALFALPRDFISIEDHLIGLYTSTLIKDDSCLQIGIGKLGSAVANALILRHRFNDVYQAFCDKLGVVKKFGDTISSLGSFAPFEKGLYASTEMISDEYMQLYDAGILKKCVYDHIGLQQLLNSNKLNERITPDILDVLLQHQVIQENLSKKDVIFLQQFGILKNNIKYHDGEFILESGEKISANLSIPTTKQYILSHCLGDTLQEGKIIHAGFILGSVELYKWLKNLPEKELALINMTSIARTNDLFWCPELLRLQRENARFVNTAMMVTLGGNIISDGLNNLQEVSGVGGQFDFVNMAQKLENARSIINCRSVRKIKSKIASNIIWQYCNATIPRHLRDIVITEYGIADCRSKLDVEIIQALLNITDSRFQPKLLKQAKKAGKIPKDYEIPKPFQQNYPDIIQTMVKPLQSKGYLKAYPFGSDLTEDELVLKETLLYLKKSNKMKLFILMLIALIDWRPDKNYQKYLIRMQLEKPKNWREFLYKKLLISVMRRNKQ